MGRTPPKLGSEATGGSLPATFTLMKVDDDDDDDGNDEEVAVEWPNISSSL